MNKHSTVNINMDESCKQNDQEKEAPEAYILYGTTFICDSKIRKSKAFRCTWLGASVAKQGGKTMKKTMGIIQTQLIWW